MKIPEFKIRTDLALEEREGLKEAAEEVSGVSFKKVGRKTVSSPDHRSEGFK